MPKNYVDGFGDLSDPETMLYYKLYLAMRCRDQQLKNPKCSAGDLYDVIQNITSLRAQLTQLHDADITLKAPTQQQINSIKALAAKVASLTNTDADLAAGLALISQIAAATQPLIQGA